MAHGLSTSLSCSFLSLYTHLSKKGGRTTTTLHTPLGQPDGVVLHYTVASLGLRIGPACEAGLSAGMRGSVCHPIEERKKQKICCACGRYDTAVNPGDVVNIIGQFDSEGVCHITDLTHFIVIDPDRLLSGTSIVSSVHCMRRFIFFPFLLPSFLLFRFH